MRYLSVCSGIEAATCAWHPLGWTPVGFSEIEPFPAAVLAHHYPDVPNLGDMTRFQEWPDDLAPDLIVGGTPCQSFSVAGLRKGLADPRGNLALVYLALADRYRPEWLVWENVPGVLSSNGGRDFGAFLGGLVQLGYGFAYRVLDAQYFGVAQRRRRVFVVANARDWRRAAAVLFERHSLSGHPAPRREAGEGTAGRAVASVAGSLDTQCGGGKLTHQSVKNGHLIGTITARMFNSLGARDVEAGALLAVDAFNQRLTGDVSKTVASRCDQDTASLVAHTLRGEGFDASEDGTGRGTPLVPVSVGCIPIDMRQASRGETMTNNRAEGSSGGAPGTGVGADGDPAPTISTSHPPAIAFSCKDHGADAGEIAPTLRSMGHDGSHANGGGQVAVAFGGQMSTPQVDVELSQTLQAKNPQAVAHAMAVRRLTPRECERLQGFRDDYTAIPWRGKDADTCPDGPRYKALGNSMAVPVMAWIGRRIAQVAGQDQQEKAA